MTTSENNLTRKDFSLPDLVKWCAGCGNYAILASVMNALPDIGVKKEDIVFVSGIGCSSRFPYYINTYGFHSLHGRAAPIASGIKLANPDLSVWMVTGDGDSMAIGGNHFIHLMRRNIDVNILLFNNRIYGLTKGQYSPTSPLGAKTKTSPDGTIEKPFLPGELAIGSGASFYARVSDTDPRTMKQIFKDAAEHKGTSVVEILENCVIFNNKVHGEITNKDVRDDNQIVLKHGEKMIFGKEKNKGLVLDGLKLKVVTIGENGITEDSLLTHDKYDPDPTLHAMLARMSFPEYPVAMGVIRTDESLPTYMELMEHQMEEALKSDGIKSIDELLKSGNTFEK